MKSKTTIVSLVLLVLAYVVNAQDYTFRVLVNKGQNEMKTGESWTPLKVGSNLKSLDEVKVGENAYLGLVHVTGKPLEVKQSGKYKVVDLAAKVGGGTSVLNKYTDFILSARENKSNNLTATGAVHRGTTKIKVYLPASEQAIIYNDNITIQWMKDDAAGPYVVTFNSMYGDELFKTETADNSVSINLNTSKFKNEDNIIVQVASKSGKGESDEYQLRRLSKADKERVRGSLNEVMPEVQEPTALNKLLLASFYEQNKLLIDAATAYQDAIKLEPNVDLFKEDYDAFLIRNLMKEPPKDK
jgi:hypothetical protein